MHTTLTIRPSKGAQIERELDREALAGKVSAKVLKRATAYYPDYEVEVIERRNATIRRRLEQRAGQTGNPLAAPGGLPTNLCQMLAVETRLAIGSASIDLHKQFSQGRPAFLVTPISPDWLRDPGALDSSVFKEVVAWSARRCRRLARKCDYRAIGVVDVAWCDRSSIGETSVWSVHAHIIVVPLITDPVEGRALIRGAFQTGHERCLDGKSLKVIRLKTAADMLWTREYVSSKLQTDMKQRRASYRDADGRLQTKNRDLYVPQALELYDAWELLPPRHRVILSGYRWRAGDVIKPLSEAETPNRR